VSEDDGVRIRYRPKATHADRPRRTPRPRKVDEESERVVAGLGEQEVPDGPKRKRGPNRRPKLDSMPVEVEGRPPLPPRKEGEVLVFRHPTTQRPVVVPDDVATAAERPYRAYKARLTGMSWEEVALLERYPNARAAAAEVNRYLEEGRALVAEASAGALIGLELARLDALQHAIWPSAMEGTLPAVSMSMQLVLARVKLMGLELEAEKGAAGGAPTTVVVPMDSEGYRRMLEEHA